MLGFENTEVNLAHNLAKQGRDLAVRVVFFQSIAVAFLSVGVFFFFQAFTALSFFYGGFVSVIANAVFGFFAFKYSGARQNKLVVQSFGRGAKIKLYITIFLAIVAFSELKLEPLPLFLGFMVSHFCQWAVMVRPTK